jgi:signal transduction histidine kinase
MIHRGATEMDQLINSILAFSRLGHQTPARRPLDLAQLSREVFAELRAGLGARQVDFKVHRLPAVNATPELLRQVMSNLLDNALKFTRPRARAVIEVGVMWPKGGDEPVFFVRDNGVGFDPERADKLFGVFQRLHPAQDFEGTGVGLAMVRRIIERHGGRVWAEAAPDEGATVFFTLPATP